jgi:uncharacterized OB-fold protein
MKKFHDFLRKGEFRVAVCTRCSKKIWPPAEFCCFCFSKTSFKKIEGIGTLIEFTTSHIHGKEELFGIVDIEGIKLIGSLSSNLSIGMKVRMVECGIRENGSPFYHFERLKRLNSYTEAESYRVSDKK